jgi:hypothetical protein
MQGIQIAADPNLDGTVRATVADLAVRHGRGDSLKEGTCLGMWGDGEIDAQRVLIDGTVTRGIAAGAGTRMTLRDAIVRNVEPAPGDGDGGGISAEAGAVLDAARIGVTLVHGFGLAAIPSDDGATGSMATIADLYVSSVRSSRIFVDPMTREPAGRPVAYGVHVGRHGALDAERVVLRDGGYGFFAVGGTLTLRTGVISGQGDAAGAEHETTATLTDVTRTGNAQDATATGGTLPEATALPLPTAICVSDCVSR